MRELQNFDVGKGKRLELENDKFCLLFISFCFIYRVLCLSNLFTFSRNPLFPGEFKKKFVIGVNPELNRRCTELFSFARNRTHQ